MGSYFKKKPYPRVILNLITPHCILLYFLDIFSLIFAGLYNIQCWFMSNYIWSDTSRLSESASESVWPWFGFTLAWNIILLSVFSSFSLFLFLSLIAFATTIGAIQYRLGAISYRWDKNIFRTLIVQCLFWMPYFRT